MMRRAILAFGLSLTLCNPVSAKPKANLGTPPADQTDSVQAQRRNMEQRSQNAEKEQQARNQIFDANVRRATGSICSGC